MSKLTSAILIGALIAGPAIAAEEIVEHKSFMDHGDGHLMDMDGAMVMGQNTTQIPPGCDKISEDQEITVHAGRKYSKPYPGTMFGFSDHEWKFKPCTRLTVHFINEDRIRHQWMMHGLPKFIYDKGMFHLEVTGPGKVSGTMILPAEDRTYLVHCDIAQHMEKGMKGQLIVGKGSAPFPSIPGLTDMAVPDDYGPKVKSTELPPPVPADAMPIPATPQAQAPASGNDNGVFVLGVILGAFGTPFALSAYRQRYQGMSFDQVLGSLANSAKDLLGKILGK